MKFKSQLVTQASGSVGGLTFAHNSGGLYARARSIPTNPNTAAQQAARTAISTLAAAWSGILTAAQRAAWLTYAENTPVTDAFGDPLVLSGQQMYIRCNQPRVRASIAAITPGPTTYGLASLAPATIVPAAAAGTVAVAFDVNDQWVAEDDAYLLVQVSRQMSPTRNFFKGPFGLAGSIAGDSTTPPSSPSDVTNPFGDVYLAGNKVFARVTAVLADGRISGSQIISGIAA